MKPNYILMDQAVDLYFLSVTPNISKRTTEITGESKNVII